MLVLCFSHFCFCFCYCFVAGIVADVVFVLFDFVANLAADLFAAFVGEVVADFVANVVVDLAIDVVVVLLLMLFADIGIDFVADIVVGFVADVVVWFCCCILLLVFYSLFFCRWFCCLGSVDGRCWLVFGMLIVAGCWWLMVVAAGCCLLLNCSWVSVVDCGFVARGFWLSRCWLWLLGVGVLCVLPMLLVAIGWGCQRSLSLGIVVCCCWLLLVVSWWWCVVGCYWFVLVGVGCSWLL